MRLQPLAGCAMLSAAVLIFRRKLPACMIRSLVFSSQLFTPILSGRVFFTLLSNAYRPHFQKKMPAGRRGSHRDGVGAVLKPEGWVKFGVGGISMGPEGLWRQTNIQGR